MKEISQKDLDSGKVKETKASHENRSFGLINQALEEMVKTLKAGNTDSIKALQAISTKFPEKQTIVVNPTQPDIKIQPDINIPQAAPPKIIVNVEDRKKTFEFEIVRDRRTHLINRIIAKEV
jgi:hypothetical protein